MSSQINPFAAGALPVELSAAGIRALGSLPVDHVQALILANISALVGHNYLNIEVTPTVDTSIYAAGDTLFDRTAIAGAARVAAGGGIIRSVTLLDKDDNTAAAITLFFLRANVAFGTLNAAPSISDANAMKIIGNVVIASGDFIDVTGSKVAPKSGLAIPFTLDSGTSLYVAATCAGTPTQTAGGIVLNVGIEQN